MQRLSKIAALIFLSLFSIGCSYVEPGYVGIVVNQYGNQKGVQDFPLKTGRVFYNPFTQDIYKFPTFTQNVVWTKDKNESSGANEEITFNSSEGSPISADVGLSYFIDGDSVPALFLKHRRDADYITKVYLRTQVRDAFNRAASKMKAVEAIGTKKEELLNTAKEELERKLGPAGFKFDTVTLVGELRVNEQVQRSISATIEASQKAIEAENKVKQSEAEAQQKVAEAEGLAKSILLEAEAKAEANRKLTESLSPELLQYEALQKWDGTMPMVVGDGALPFIEIKKQ